MAKDRDPNRGKRQLKADFSSEEALQRFKDFCDEFGLSYSQLLEAFAEYGMAAVMNDRFDIYKYLVRSKLPWLRKYDIDIAALKKDLGRDE